MKTRIAIAAVCVAGLGFAQSTQTTNMMRSRLPRESASAVSLIVGKWKPAPKKTAQMMIAKYGQPHEATASRIIWYNNGPWKYTIIEDIEIPHSFPMPHKDLMRQVIDYKVPADRVDDLALYDGSVIFDRTPGELSARCDKEQANFLAINLGNDVVTGKRSVSAARKFYSRAIAAMMKGRTNSEQRRYLNGFTFRVPRSNTAFVDKPVPPR